MRFPFVLLLTMAVLQPIRAEQDASTRIAAPALGWVFDSEAKSVRPISGTLGAALVGSPLDLGIPLIAAEIASQRAFAIVVSEDNQPRIANLATASILGLDDVLLSPDRIVFSPSASAALLYSVKDSRLQVITGLPESPKVIRNVAVPDSSGAAAALAVSDDGARGLLVFNDDSVWMWDSNGAAYPTAAQAIAIAYRAGASDAIAVNRKNELYRIDSDGSISSAGAIAGEDLGTPAGVRVSADGSLAFVAYSKGLIAEIDPAAGNVRTTSCGCAATGLFAVNAPSTFRVNDATADSPLLLVNMAAAGPRVWFVPNDRGER